MLALRRLLGDEVLRQQVADCDGLVSLLTDRIDAPLMDAAPRLKVVSNYAVGFNNVDVGAATARGIAVGNTPGVLTDATADMAFCLLIAAARRVVEGHRYAQEGQWKTWEPLGHLGQDLVGRTLGVIGMGRIGYALAKRCHFGWDMQILYHDVHRQAVCGGRGSQRRPRAAFSGSSPMEPRSRAAVWNPLRSKSGPLFALTWSRACSQIRSPTLYDGACPGQPR